MPDSIHDYDNYVRDLARTQTGEGYWTSACNGGPVFTAKVLVALRFAKQIDEIGPAKLRKMVGYLCDKQDRKDGSFDPWVTSDACRPGDEDKGAVRSTTAIVIAGLRASGIKTVQLPGRPEVSVGDVVKGAEEFLRKDRKDADDSRAKDDDHSPAWLYKRVIDRGREGDYAALYLAMAGVIDVKDLPSSPLVFRLVPGSEVVLEQRVNLLLPFQLLSYDVIVQYLRNGKRPPVRPDVKAFATAIVEASRQTTLSDLKLRVGGVVSGLVDSAAQTLRGWRDLSSAGPSFVEGERLSAFLARHSNQDGSWLYGDSITTSLAVAALHAIGTPATDRRIARAVNWLKALSDHHEFVPLFSADVWITSFRVRALIAQGLEPWNEPLLRSLTWLTSVQRNGSWAFQAGNTALPDMDDTSMALAALAIAYNVEQAARGEGATRDGFGATLRGKIEQALLAGRAWLLQRQNCDGGWASFQSGLPSKPPGPFLTTHPPMPKDSVLARWDFLLNPPPELGDPAVEDVTGRVLFALGNAGMRAYDPPIAEAIEFLKRSQMESGAFWGRWTVGYVPATAWVLRGLVAVRADLTEGWIQSAIDFLVNTQKGGYWGENIDVVRFPARAGRGSPTRFHTATALCGLIDVARAGGLTAEAQSKDCLSAVNEDWDEKTHSNAGADGVVHPLVPPESFYTIPGLDRDIECEARGLSRQLEEIPVRGSTPVAARPKVVLGRVTLTRVDSTHGSLDDLLHEGDDGAEAVLKGLNEAQDLTPFFRRLASLDERAAEPLTKSNSSNGLVERLDSLTKTVEGSGPTERQRSVAKELFRESGWGVATALFCSSLPQCFAAEKGAAVLADTGRFEHSAERRIIETMQFVFDVATGEPEVMKESARRVRIMHEVVRRGRLLGKHDHATLGKPINQQHLLLTMLSFSTMVTDGLRSIGFTVDDEQEDAWLAVWREVGGHLGIKAKHLARVDTPANAQRTLQALRATAWATSPSGVSLGRTLNSLLQSFVPATALSRLPVAMIRHMAGDSCADLLDLEEADWTALLVKIGANVTKLGEEMFDQSPIKYAAHAIGFHVLEGLANRPRQGKTSTFRIPPDFLEDWQRKLREHRLA